MGRRRDIANGVGRLFLMITNSNRNFLYVATVLCPTCVVCRVRRRALLSVRFPRGQLSDQTVHCDCKQDRISVGLPGTYPRTMQQGQWCSLQDTSLSQSKGDGKVFLFSIKHKFSLWEDGEGRHIANLISLPMHVGHYYRTCVRDHINILLCNSIESVRHQYS